MTVSFKETARALTKADFSWVENRLGIALPEDIKAHYLGQNGGNPEPRFFPKDGEMYGISQFLSICSGNMAVGFEETYEDLVFNTPEFPQGYIPFAIDDGGDYFVYSVMGGSYGKIYLNQTEYFDDESDDRFILYLAASFKEFVGSLSEKTGE